MYTIALFHIIFIQCVDVSQSISDYYNLGTESYHYQVTADDFILLRASKLCYQLAWLAILFSVARLIAAVR